MAEKAISGIIKKYSKDIVMLDGFFQWALNPTSMSAGYGIDKNYSYIEKNLRIAHELSTTELDNIVNKLKNECNKFVELQKDKHDIVKFREYVINEISTNYFDSFSKFTLKKIKKSSEQVKNFLNIYQKSQFREYECLCTQYNAIYGEDIEEEQLVRSGILKVLYFISSGNLENRHSDPIFIPFLGDIIKRTKLKKWKPDRPNVKNFINSLRQKRENFTINFLVTLMKKNLLCNYLLKGSKILSGKGITGFYSNPHSKDLDYGGISFLIKNDLFNSIKKYVEEDLREKTEKILKMLEFEIQNKSPPSNKDLIKIANLNIDEIEIYEDLLNRLPRESFQENQDIKNKASDTIRHFEEPSLYDLLTTMKYDIETARNVGKYLIDSKMINELSRVPKQITSSSIISSTEPPIIDKIICNNCKTILPDDLDSEYCPYCGSSNILKIFK